MIIATISIKFLPGTAISDAFAEALRLASTLNVFVEFPFNEITCSIGPGGSVSKGTLEYHEAIKGETFKGKLKIAHG